MPPTISGRRVARCLSGFVFFSLLISLTTSAQGQADSAPTKPKRSLAEIRGLATPAAEKEKEPTPGPTPKVEKDATPPPVGFLGDPSKFTRLGGWGSFGNAMGEFGFAKSTLIMMPPVQEELKLTDEQKARLRELQLEMRKKGEEMGKSMRDKAGDDPFKASENLPIAARVVQFTSMISQISTLARENEASLERLLKSPQRKRLNQIALQMEGISALTKPEIVEALGMSEEEEEAIRQILGQARTMKMTTWIGSMMAMRPDRRPGRETNPNPDATAPKANPGPPDPSTDKKGDPAPKGKEDDPKARADREKAMRTQFESMRNKTDQIQDRTVREISQVLTKAQKAKFENLLGPPFDPRKINNLNLGGGPPRRDGSTPPVVEEKGAPKKP